MGHLLTEIAGDADRPRVQRSDTAAALADVRHDLGLA